MDSQYGYLYGYPDMILSCAMDLPNLNLTYVFILVWETPHGTVDNQFAGLLNQVLV